MGCKCVDKELEKNNEIKKLEEEDNEQFQVSNNNIISNSKKGIFSLGQNPEFNQDILPSEQKYEEILKNLPPKISENKMKYSNEFKGNYLQNIKSKYILQCIFANITEKKLLKIVKYNKFIQKKLDKDINDYKKYLEVIIEIFPINKEEKNTFINYKEKEKIYYHIYFNDEKEEKKRNYFFKNEKVSIIKIIIDYQIKSFEELFSGCECIEKMNFIKFNRKDINNASAMFYYCSSLKELNLNNFNTSNIISMRGMFMFCSSLEELDLNNFITNNVTDMSSMFMNCIKLKKLNIYNFNTINVTNMCNMFRQCSSLKELNINNFNTDKVQFMFGMFYECPAELTKKIKNLNLHIKDEAFDYLLHGQICLAAKKDVVYKFSVKDSPNFIGFKIIPLENENEGIS